MTHLVIYAFLIGVAAGLRSLTAPAVVSWAVRLGKLHPNNPALDFLGHSATPYILTVLAIGELFADKLAIAPSRKALPGFVARAVTGAICGAVLGADGGELAVGAMAGAVGAIAGTLGGYEVRVRLAKAAGKDLPVALIEDVIAIGGAFLLVWRG